ncbi:MAG TPA: hypothetical protein DCG78_00665 [Anaerolineaceae bacterium]|nr:hypothetical protein [Anaerolineaceae bacterium]
MNKKIYYSSTDDSFLRSTGPFKILSADRSIKGIISPKKLKTPLDYIVISKKIYGDTKICKFESSK